jgi:hypothetical protein
MSAESNPTPSEGSKKESWLKTIVGVGPIQGPLNFVLILIFGIGIGFVICISSLISFPFIYEPLIGGAVRETIAAIPTPTLQPTYTLMPTYTPYVVMPVIPISQTASITPSLTPSKTPTPTCAFAGQTDDETIHNLINAEASAANSQSIDTIVAIFSPDAVFEDYAQNGSNGSPPKTWIGPLVRYKDDLFINAKLKDVQNFDISKAGSSSDGNTAWYTSGSKGFYLSKGDWQEFNNGSLVGKNKTQYGSNHWTLQRKPDGCWAIFRFAFNAGHISFPPQ